MSLFQKFFKRPATGDVSDPDDGFLFDPLDDSFIENPYPILSRLRRKQPLHRSKSGAWILTRHADVRSALMDERLGNAPSSFAVVNKRNAEKYVCAQVANHILPFLDPPIHTLKRDVISKSFFSISRQLSESDGHRVDELASQILAELTARKGFDVIHDYGTPYSAELMCRLLGLPVEDKLQLTAWAESFLYLFSIIPDQATLERVNEHLSEFRDYAKTQIKNKLQTPAEDWLSVLVAMNVEAGDVLSEDEIADNLMLLFADGVENVDRMLGTCIKLVVETPGLKQSLLNNKAQIPRFVDESLRFETPVQFIGRVTIEELDIHGQAIAPDSVILLMLGSANRDETVFPQAEQFLLERDNRETLSFGRGKHTCLGRALVKQQLVSTVAALLDRMPNFTLANRDLYWEKRLGHRWLTGLEISIN